MSGELTGDRVNGVERTNDVLVLYPWGIDSVMNKSMGAGVRVGLLSEFLRDQGYAVTVASIGLRSREISSNGIRFIEYRYPSNPVLLVLYGCALTLAKMTNAHALRALLYFNFHRVDPVFTRRIGDLASSYAQVLLEYPFWYAMLTGTNVILTNHDILSESWAGRRKNVLGRLLYRTVLRNELSAMRKMTRTVVVSESDRDFFRSQAAGDPVVISNPVRLPELSADRSRQAGDKPVALFIGGGWYPNVLAAEAIVDRIAPRCPGITFVVAGECSSGLRRVPPNVTCLGQISASMLDACYREATYAVIPLLEGTGSSLKTVEALSYGKVIITTAVGVRGIAFQDGVHGTVCDDLDRFPEVLQQLEQDPDRRAAISRNAIALSKDYDYRVIFRKYLDLMHVSARDGEAWNAEGGRAR